MSSDVYALQFGGGSGPIVLSHVSCRGYEDSLLDCSVHSHYNISYCDLSENVGVRCLNGIIILY